jgi:hypothetical protein
VVDPLALQVVVTPVKWIPQLGKSGPQAFSPQPNDLELKEVGNREWMPIDAKEELGEGEISLARLQRCAGAQLRRRAWLHSSFNRIVPA